MSDQIEKLLGLGPFDRERRIPGTRPVEGRAYLYVSCPTVDEDIRALFTKVARKISPPIAKDGAAMNEDCKVILPTGECYFAMSIKGDIAGWRAQIEQGAAALNLRLASVVEDKLVLDDGREVPLSKCQVRFDADATGRAHP